MNWIKNFNRAMDLIESNITKELTIEEIAEEANSSKFHFIRVFSMLAGKTLGEYIRERKLSIAAQDVLNKEKKIIDIALKYGYEEPGSFTKAFKRFHGFTPKQVRDSNRVLKAAPPLRFTIEVKGEVKMDYRIEKKDGFKVVGTSTEVTWKNGDNFKIIPAFWNDKYLDGTASEAIFKATSMGLLGICYGTNMESETFRYLIGHEGEEKSDKLNDVLDVPSSTWAVFPFKGQLEGLRKLWERIYSEWFPATNYEHAAAPEVERYMAYDYTTKDVTVEVWIPVVVKEESDK